MMLLSWPFSVDISNRAYHAIGYETQNITSGRSCENCIHTLAWAKSKGPVKSMTNFSSKRTSRTINGNKTSTREDAYLNVSSNCCSFIPCHYGMALEKLAWADYISFKSSYLGCGNNASLEHHRTHKKLLGGICPPNMHKLPQRSRPMQHQRLPGLA